MKRHLWTRFVRALVSPKSNRQIRRGTPPRLKLERLEDRLAPATTFIWTGAGANPNWSNPANWVGNVAPTGDPAAQESLVFNDSAISFVSNNNLVGATFDRITFSGNNYILTGNRITLGTPSITGSGSIFVNALTTGSRIEFDIELGATLGTKQFITVNQGADLLINGRLSGASTPELAKQGLGTLILAGDNIAFNGPITLENNAGILRITHVNALGSTAAGTTIGTNSQLQVSNVVGVIPEELILNGPGISSDGALQNFAGNNIWGGPIKLDSTSTLGATAGTTLTITGQVSDLGAGHSLIKEGLGTVVLAAANTYRGLTTINDGILAISHPLALGEGGTAQNGTVVNRTLTKTGTLELRGDVGGGFTVLDELLTLNGPGFGGVGALRNLTGNNTWASTVTLGSQAPNGFDVQIGVAANTNLTISGVVTRRLAPDAPVSLTKVGPGRLIFNNANTYTATTTIAAGILNIRDSSALSTGAVFVNNGATLELEIDTGFDAKGRNLSNDSVTGVFNRLVVSNTLTMTGNGVNNGGALRSVSGINTYTGGITIQTSAAIGVDPDPTPSNSNLYFTNDFSLTVTGNIGEPTGSPASLVKVGTGHLILPNANSYTNTTTIQQGWITIRNGGSLGGLLPFISDTLLPAATVAEGAALHIKPLTAGASINLIKPLILSGTGITHPFALISQKGALMSLSGQNTVGGTEFTRKTDIRLNGQAGIGVELLGPSTVSTLTITSSIANGTTAGGIVKLGSQLLALQGDGTYTGANTIREGVLRVQHNSALGTASTGTIATGNNTYTTTTTTVDRGIAELQSITVGGTPGTYTLTFNGHTTAPISHSATAAEVQAALNALPSISGVGGTVSVTQSGNVYMVQFLGSLVGFNQPQLVATSSGGPILTIATLMNGDGAALQLQSSVAWLNGGVSTGMNIWHENLVLNSPGNTAFGSSALTVLGNDNLWRGSVNLLDSATIQVPPSARLTIFGGVTDTGAPTVSGSNLTLIGGGKLALGGNGTFRGTTYVDEGTLVVANNSALGATGISEVQQVELTGFSLGTFTLEFNGSVTPELPFIATAAQVQAALNALPSIAGVNGSVSVSRTDDVFTITFGGSFFGFDQPQLIGQGFGGANVASITTLVQGGGGTIVADGASLQLQGSVAIAGEPLILQGKGTANTNNVPVGWFNEGPSPSNNWPAPNIPSAVTGRVTGVVADPSDPNVIYAATAAGGVWKTKNGGQTWLPLFDLQNGTSEVQDITVTGTGGGFTIEFMGHVTPVLPVGASEIVVQAALNDLPSIGGVFGSVTVIQTGNTYRVTFGGDLASENVPPMIATRVGGSGGATATVTTIGDGIPSNAVMYVGTITIDTNQFLFNTSTPNPNYRAIYIGTGETNNSSDSYYGTGIYRSTDAGVHWTLVSGTQHQYLTVTGLAGNYTLSFNGSEQSSSLGVQATAAQVKAALDGLSTIGGVGSSVNVTRTGIAEVQQFSVIGSQGTFILGFNGAFTAELAYNAAAADVQTALNGLSTIGGVGGNVTVTSTSANNVTTYTVTFGGTLNIFTQPLLVGQGVGGTPPPVVTTPTRLVTGGARYDITFNGFLGTVDNPLIQATATGGATANVVINNPFNPFLYKGISKILIDPANTNLLYVASGDGALGVNEVQRIRPRLNNGQTFTLTFTGRDSTGTVVSLTTVPILFDNSNNQTRQQMRADIENALNALANIGGIGGFVIVQVQNGGMLGLRFNITFSGVLSETNVQQLTGNPPPPPGFPSLEIVTTRQGQSQKVINGTEGGAGVWRLFNNTWENLTAVVSTKRNSVPTTQSLPPTEGAFAISGPNTTGTGNPNPPRTPGPDDDYRITFPSTQATWSDIALIYTDRNNTPNGGVGPAGPVLYAALGTADGGALTPNPNNGIFWTKNPNVANVNSVIWYVGDPGGSPFSSPAVDPEPNSVDQRSSSGTPLGQFLIPVQPSGTPPQPAIALNGNIKLSAVAGTYLNTSTVYASVATPNRTLRGLYVTNNGGQTWTQVTVPSYMAAQGDYANAILAVTAQQVFVGGYEQNPTTHLGNVLRTLDGGANWVDFSNSGFGPHTGIHSFFRDSSGRILVGTDGGVWRLETNGLWVNLNGNMTIAQVNGIASHPTNLGIMLAGIQSNGVARFNNGLAWTSTSGGGGGQVRIDQQNPNFAYQVTLNRGANATLSRSTNGGLTWTPLNVTLTREVVPLLLDSVNTSRLLVGGSNLQESTDRGTTWVPLNNSVPLGNRLVAAAAIATFQGAFVPDPDFPLVTDKGINIYDPDTIYYTTGETILVSKNRGITWVERVDGVDGLGSLFDIQVDPRNRDTAYVVRNALGHGKVFKTTNAGQDWVDITNNLPDLAVWKIVIDPRSGDLYIGTDNGVYLLPQGDTTSNWVRFGSGLGNVQVRDLELNLNTNTLRAGTYGRGVFLLYLDDSSAEAGALQAVSGTSTWTGPIYLIGSANENEVHIGANGTQVLQNGFATASVNISGSIRDYFVGSDPRLVKIGEGDVIFSGSNTYAGITEVREGVLVVRNARALGSPNGHTEVMDGAALELESDLELEPITINGNGILFNGHFTGALRNVANNNTYTGPLTLGTDTTIGVDSGSSLTIGSKAGLQGIGTIGDDGAGFQLTKELTGTLILASANTYEGLTEIVAGAIQVRHGNALGSTTAATRVRDGAQLQMFASPENPLVVEGETLILAGTGIDGTGALLNVGGETTWRGPIQLNTLPGFAPNTLPPGAVAFGVSTATGNLIIDDQISQALASGLIKVGPGRMTLSQANTYTGTTFINAGTLRVQHNGALGTNNTQEIQRVTVNGPPGSTFTLSFNGVLTTNLAFNATAAQVQTALNNILPAGITAAVVRTTTTAGLPGNTVTSFVFTVTFTTTPAGQNLPLMGVLVNGGASAAVSVVADGGIGTRVATGATLEIDGSASNLNIVGETLALNGNGVGGNGALRNVAGNNTWTGGVILQTNTSMGAAANSELLISGQVQDPVIQQFFNPPTSAPVPSASLTKVGQGTIALSNANPYGGQTFVNQGILNIRNAGALGTTGPEIQRVTLNVTGTVGTFQLSFRGEFTSPLAFDVPASGGVGPTASMQNALNALSTIGGVGGSVTVTQSGNVYTITFGGTLAIGNQPQIFGIGFSGVTVVVDTFRDGPEGTVVASGATLQVQGGITVSTEDLTINGPGFQGRGALENLSGENAWTRPILLGSSSSIGAAAGRLTIPTSINEASPGFAVTKVGPATVRYSGGAGTSNTYTGLTQINEGTLELAKTSGAVAINGNLTIGDTLAGDAVAHWLESNQVIDPATIRVESDGLLDLNGLAETVATLRILDGEARTGDNGTLTVSELEMVGGQITLGDNSQLVMNGNVTATSSATEQGLITGTGTFDLNGTTRTFFVNDGPQATDLRFGPGTTIAGGSAGLIKRGAGRMEIDGVGTYTGPTEIFVGELQVDGSIGNVQLKGGTLSGTGTVGTITGGSPAVGTVAPGASGPGTLRSGSAEWGSETNFVVDLDPVLGSDLLEVDGDIDLGNANLVALIGPNVAVGIPFTIIQTLNGGEVIGQFAQGTVTFIDGKKYLIQYFTDHVVIIRTKADVILTLNSSANPSVYGQEVIYTFTVTPESGSGTIPSTTQVTFTFDTVFTETKNIGTGTVTFDPQLLIGGPLAVGAHTLRADFLGDDDFNAATIHLTPNQQVNKASTAIVVNSLPPSLVAGQPLVVSAQVNAVAPGGSYPGSSLPSGFVTVSINGGAPSDPVALDASSNANFPINGLPAGTHQVVVTYLGDGNYLGSVSEEYQIVVDKASTTLVVGVPNLSLARGNDMTFTATVSPAAPGSGVATGPVQFYLDVINPLNLIGVGSLDTNGVASVTSNTLPAGVRTIIAVYAGDNNFLGSQGSNSYTVLPAVTTTTLTSSRPTSSVFGENVTFEATVQSVLPVNGIPTGQVTFRIDGVFHSTVTLNAQGKASFTTNSLAVGNRLITAEFFDPTQPDINDQFGPSSASITQVVNQSNTAVVSVVGAPAVSVAGQLVTYTATVTSVAPGSGVPNGTVTFLVDGQEVGTAPLVGNVATLPIPFLSAGTFTVTANYNGSTSYLPSSLSVQRQINKSDTSTTVTLSPMTPVSGQTLTFTAQVSPVAPGGTAPGSFVPSGQVVFTLDGVNQPPVNLVNGVAQLIVPGLPAGQHRISVAYLGDANYNLSETSSDLIFSVGKSATNVVITTPSTPLAKGNDMTFTATVSAAAPGSGIPTGQLTFFYNTISTGTQMGTFFLVNGTASITTNSLPAGPLTIIAVYVGDENFLSKTETTPYTVLPAVTTTALTSSHPGGSRFGEAVTFEAFVSPVIPANGIPFGEVTFKVDGVPLIPSVSLDSTGRARLTVDSLLVGSRTITAEFNDTTLPVSDVQFATSSATITQVVAKADTTAEVASLLPISVVGQQVTIQARIQSVLPGGGIPTGPVSFFVNGQLRGQAAVIDGIATVQILFNAAGTFNVTARYLGSDNHNASPMSDPIQQRVVPFASQVGITQSTANSVFAQAVTFTATVRGGPLNGPRNQIPPGTVTFIIDGVARPAVALNANGQAQLTTPLGVGFHTIQARYNGAAQYAGSVSQTIGHNTVRANTTTTISTPRNPAYIGQGIQVTARITTNAPGGGIPAGTVTFFVNGVAQTPVPVNANGIATMNIGALPIGRHVIAAHYSGSGNHVNSAAAMFQDVSGPTQLTAELIGTPLNGSPFTLRVFARGHDNSLAPGYNQPVAIAILSTPPGGTITGSRNTTFVNGVANFDDLRLTRNGVYRIRIISGSLILDLTIDNQGRLT